MDGTMENLSFTLLDLFLIFSYLSVVFLHASDLHTVAFPFSRPLLDVRTHHRSYRRVSRFTISVIVMCRLQMLKQREQALSALVFITPASHCELRP